MLLEIITASIKFLNKSFCFLLRPGVLEEMQAPQAEGSVLYLKNRQREKEI